METEHSPSSAPRLFTPIWIGLLAWFLSYVALLAWKWPDINFPPVWLLLPYVIGAAAMLATTASLKAKGAIPEEAAKKLALCFLLPPIWAIVMALAVFWISPGARAGSDFHASLTPILLVFCVLATLYASRRSATIAGDRWARLIFPPAVAVTLVAAHVAWTIMRSHEFRFRDAFVLEIENVEYREPGLAISGTLEVHKAGDYEVAAKSYSDMVPEGLINEARVIWGEGADPNHEGRHPFNLVWDQGEFRKVAGAGPETMPDFYDNIPFLEVRMADDKTMLRQFPLLPSPSLE